MAVKTHTIKDAGVPLVVDPFTRKVTVPATERVIGVVGDHCSEKVTFQVPKEIDKHNMPECDRKYVSWLNVEGTPGTDELKLVEGTEDLYEWLVRDALTVAKGLVSFSLHFECDDPETGKQNYSWGTHTCNACEILDSLNAKLGAYAAIYIDGETLVFADYTPVKDDKLDLTSCVLPTGTLVIRKEGRHDVGRYAYAHVEALHEAPTITIADGEVKAEADGLEATKPLNAPDITIADGKVKAEANGLEATEPLDAPVVSVADDGTVTARANGLVTSRHLSTFDQDGVFIKANIREGVSIFGVTGTMVQGFVPEYVTVEFGLHDADRLGLGVAIYYQALDALTPTVKRLGGDVGRFDTFKGAVVVLSPSSMQYFDIHAEGATLEGVRQVDSLYGYQPGLPLVLQITGDNPKIYLSYKMGG